MCCLDKQNCGCQSCKKNVKELDSDETLNEIIKLGKQIGLDVTSLENAAKSESDNQVKDELHDMDEFHDCPKKLKIF